MGFPLPAVGYVVPKGRGAETRPNNQENVTNRRRVTDFLNSIQDAYVRFPNSGRFFFPPEWGNADVIIRPTQFETDIGERITLHRVLYGLRSGGTVVVPRIKDILNSNDESVQLMRDYENKGIAFLPLDKIRFGRIASSAHVVRIADVILMNARNAVDNAIKQKKDFLLEPRPINEPIRQDAA